MYDDEDEQSSEELRPNDRLQRLAAFNGNLLKAIDEKDALRMAGEAVEEFGHDRTTRKPWEDMAKKSLELAAQKPGEKLTPWRNASNVNYPTLTVAAMQFAARALPAILKGDEVLFCKVVGGDPFGFKAQRAKRLSTFTNDQIVYECDEWEPGTDALLHALPIIGSGFRKVSWDTSLGRPRLDYANALKIYADPNAASFEQAPRITQEFDRYPHQVAQNIKSGQWSTNAWEPGYEKREKPCSYIEQHRFLDLDGDGLPEPYIMTVNMHNHKPVRLDSAFDPRDLRVGETGDVEAVTRFLPWVDYSFLPDPEGLLYGTGFGKLLDSLQASIDTLLNQAIDAGTLANAPGGFIGQGLNIRGGTYRLEPNTFKIVNANADDIRKSIYTHDFRGPSPVTFQILDLLLGAAKDITAVKDVLTGEAPSNQPAASTLALIEQGLTVFTAIYKRIYRGLRKEYKLVFRLNHRYLSEERYRETLDMPLKMPQLPQGVPIPPEVQQEIQEEAMRGVSREDFAIGDYDVRPISDPSAVTQMQQLAKANFLAQRAQAAPDLYNRQVAERRILEAARIEGIDEVLTPPANPMAEIQAQGVQAEIEEKKQKARKTGAEADLTAMEAKEKAFEQGAIEGSMGGMAGEPDNAMGDGPIEGPGGAPEAAMVA